jgi:hypothetical protein
MRLVTVALLLTSATALAHQVDFEHIDEVLDYERARALGFVLEQTEETWTDDTGYIGEPFRQYPAIRIIIRAPASVNGGKLIGESPMHECQEIVGKNWEPSDENGVSTSEYIVLKERAYCFKTVSIYKRGDEWTFYWINYIP